jgi:hypothetical protein
MLVETDSYDQIMDEVNELYRPKKINKELFGKDINMLVEIKGLIVATIKTWKLQVEMYNNSRRNAYMWKRIAENERMNKCIQSHK